MLTTYLKAGLTDPRSAIYWVLHGSEELVWHQTARLLRRSESEIQRFSDESNESLPDLVDTLRQLPYLGWLIGYRQLYTIVRATSPDVVVETGVGTGVSSAFILDALSRNRRGELWSIDLPNYERVYMPKLHKTPVTIIPEGKEPGFLVPDALRDRWHLVLGDTRSRLPQVMGSVDRVDLFLHDSEHTYEAMMFEFETVWPHLREQGVLLCDDVMWNSAFSDFCRRQSAHPVYLWFAGMAGTRK